MIQSFGQSLDKSPCTTEEESSVARRPLVVPELAESYAECLAEIANRRGLPADVRRKAMLAHNEILMLRQMLDTIKGHFSDAVEHIETLESKTRPRGRHALVWGERPNAV